MEQMLPSSANVMRERRRKAKARLTPAARSKASSSAGVENLTATRSNIDLPGAVRIDIYRPCCRAALREIWHRTGDVAELDDVFLNGPRLCASFM